MHIFTPNRSAILMMTVFGGLSVSFVSPASAQACREVTQITNSSDIFHGAQCNFTKCQCRAQACELCTSTIPGAPANCRVSFRDATCPAAFVQPPPSPAQRPQLNLSLSRNQLGYDISYSGTGFQPGQTIYMCLNGLPGRAAILATGVFSNVGGGGTITGDVRQTCRGNLSGIATLQASDASCKAVIATATFNAPCSF
jgi:hypothetical protein